MNIETKVEYHRHRAVRLDSAVTYEFMVVGVVRPGVEGGSGKSLVTSAPCSSSVSLYIEYVEFSEAWVDAIRNRFCTSSSVVSPSSAASNDAIA
jgi:hypothetical protein